jgi:hypothetical protein
VALNLNDGVDVERFVEDTKSNPLPYVCGEGDGRYLSIGCNVLARAGYRVLHIQPDAERPMRAIVIFERR